MTVPLRIAAGSYVMIVTFLSFSCGNSPILGRNFGNVGEWESILHVEEVNAQVGVSLFLQV